MIMQEHLAVFLRAPMAGQLNLFFPRSFVYLSRNFLHFPMTTLTDSLVASCILQATALSKCLVHQVPDEGSHME